MIRKTFLLIIILAVALSSAHAKQINENQARAIAGQFFKVDMPQQPAALRGKGATAAYYVFNNPQQPGWVIVAGDDRARSILAYGDEDYFDTEEVPECVQDWLNDYAEQIANMSNNASPSTASAPIQSPAATMKSRVAPILASKWAQGKPFNQQCPSYTTTSGTQYSPAGCVAIAMAQILYYYQSGYGSIAIPAYTSKSGTFTNERPALPATTFNYSIMNPWYDNADNTSASAVETARLIKYCGQSVKMDYGKNTSSATSQRNAFVYYFGFDNNARQLARTDYNATEWENMIYTELAQGRPVYMSARKTSGGHAFICDGYDSGLFHINWGWRGHQNGYFALNALNDDNSGGTGAAAGDEGYTINVQIMTGLQPSLGNSTSNTNGNIVGLYSSCQVGSTSYSRSSSSVAFTNVSLTAYYWNYSDQSYTYDFGWGLYDSNGNLISTHTVATNKTLEAHYYTYPQGLISVGKNITSGTYYLKPVCRLAGSSTYYPCRGAGVNYVKATITSTTLTLQLFDELSIHDLKINSVTTGSVKKVGSPMQLNLGVSNQGITDYNSIYMWVNDNRVSGTYTDIAPGASGTVVMNYTPSAAGSIAFKFTADTTGTKLLKTFNTTINSATAATITGSNISASVSGTTYNATILVKNTNTNTYNDYIVAKLYKKDPNSGTTGYYTGAQSQTVYLGYNNTTTLNFAFSNLDYNETYFAILYYYSNGELVRISSTSSRKIASPYNVLDVNQDGSVTAADVTAVYSTLLGSSNRYRQYSDVNGDGEVTAADITKLYEHLLNQ